MDALAEHIGLSRAGIQKLVRASGASRSRPSAATAVAIAEAFGIDVRDLMSPAHEALQAGVDAFEDAPIRDAAKVPDEVLGESRRLTVVRGSQAEAAGFKPTTIKRGKPTTTKTTKRKGARK
jgi:transcriptional regulator with XRE-family HTH domain